MMLLQRRFVNRRKKKGKFVLQFKYFVYICNVIVHGTNKSTERNAPRVEVVTLNYILITINLCSFKPCNSWESGQGKSLEYGETKLLGREIEMVRELLTLKSYGFMNFIRTKIQK